MRDLPLIAFSLRSAQLPGGRPRGLPVLALGVSLHAWGLRLRRTSAHSRLRAQPYCLLGLRHHERPGMLFRSSMPCLQIPLTNASSAALRLPSHGSGPGWFATPSPYDSFIRYSKPVYPGAIRSSLPSLYIPLSNASSAASRLPSHGSGPGWFATPFLYDSHIHYSTPVYPDAIRPTADSRASSCGPVFAPLTEPPVAPMARDEPSHSRANGNPCGARQSRSPA